jgi:phage baseplate assembly protein W
MPTTEKTSEIDQIRKRFDDSVDGRERIGSPEYGIVLREMIDAPAPKVSTVAHERKSAPSAFGVEGREVLLP